MDEPRKGTDLKKEGRPSRKAVLLIVLLMCLPLANLGHAAIPGFFCGGPMPATGIGTPTQTDLHLQLFLLEYQKDCPAGSEMITYQALGDRVAAQAAIRHETGPNTQQNPWTFYATDSNMTSAEYYQTYMDVFHPFRPALASQINHFPILINGFAVGYNLGACTSSSQIRLTSETLGLIYSGLVSTWNHPYVLRDNPGNTQLASCSQSLKVAVRGEEAGSTLVMKDYLSQENPAFSVYRTKELNTVWPSSLTPACYGVGEIGMLGCLRTPGMIAYVEYKAAQDRGTPMAALENATPGNFVAPSTTTSLGYPDNCQIAAESVPTRPTATDWGSVSLTGARSGYPLCGFSYILVFKAMLHAYQNSITVGAVRNTVDYMQTIASDDVQNQLSAYGYAPLPLVYRTLIRQGIGEISWF